MKVNAQRLAEIAARARAAFRGPWTHGTFTVECDPEAERCPAPDDCEGEREALRIDAPEEYPDGQVVCDVYGLETFAAPNAAFLANSRVDVPDLVDDLTETRTELERLEWSARMQGEPACPRCSAVWKYTRGKHDTGCTLGAALGRS